MASGEPILGSEGRNSEGGRTRSQEGEALVSGGKGEKGEEISLRIVRSNQPVCQSQFVPTILGMYPWYYPPQAVILNT